MDTVEILKKARELISDESRWTQGWYAKNNNGAWTSWIGPDAVCFCSIGAMAHVSKDAVFVIESSPAFAALASAMQEDHDQHENVVAEFNDMHTHAEVLAAFDRAIAAVSKEA